MSIRRAIRSPIYGAIRTSLLRAMGGGWVEPPFAQGMDIFSRADSASSLGTASTGEAWTAHTGTWGITGRRAYLVTQAGDSVATVNAVADIDVSVDIVYGGDSGLIFRAIDDQNYWLLFILSGQAKLFTRVAGTYTQRGTTYTMPSGTVQGATYNLRVTASGTNITAFVDGVSAITISLAQFQTATRVGLRQNAAASTGSLFANLFWKPFGAATTRKVLYWNGDKYSPGVLLADTSAPRTFLGWANPNKEGVTLATGDMWRKWNFTGQAVNVIVDTDMATDPDDAFDVAALLQMKQAGMVNLLGIGVGSGTDYGPGVVRALDQYYADGNVPVASYRVIDSAFQPSTSAYYVSFFGAFPHTGVGLVSAGGITNTTTAYRTWLANSSGNVVMICTGFARAITALLASPADGISALTGSQLVAAKVSRIWMVAGLYPNSGAGAEFNIAQDPAAFNTLATTCPVPITWGILTTPTGQSIDSYLGNVGGAYLSARQTASHPLKYIIDNSSFVGVGRPPYSMATIFGAILGLGRFRTTAIAGTNAINSGTGANTFTDGAGTQQRLAEPNVADTLGDGSKGAHLKEAEAIVAADAFKSSVLTWNGSAWA